VYNKKKQLKAVIKGLREKYIEGQVTDLEVLILLLVLEKEQKMNIHSVTLALRYIFRDKVKINKLIEASYFKVSDELMDKIIKDASERRKNERTN